MLTIFVAEDQLLIQKDLCIKLQKARSGITIVGTALNGQEAYEKIQVLHPDILFTDIKMPVESGLDLIKRLKEKNIMVKTVILSGYRDFEYARQSLKLGVDEYLLKPVSIEDLAYTLNTLSEKIESEREQEVLFFLDDLLSNTETLSDRNILPPQLKYNYYYAVLIHSGSLSSIPLTDIYLQKDSLPTLSKDELCRKYLSSDESLYFVNSVNKDETFLLLCLNHLKYNKIEQMCKDILNDLETFGYPITLCISQKMTSLFDLGINGNFMRTQIASQLTFGFSSILYQKNFISNESPLELLDDFTDRQFKFDIRNKNLDGFLKHLDNFLKICRKKQITQKNLDYYLKKILHYFINNSSKQTFNSILLEVDEYLSISKNYEDLSVSLSFLFEQLFKDTFMDIPSYTTSSDLIDHVVEYIHTHFSEEISIQDIASNFSVTSAYLSRLFKKQKKIPPIEYLTNYRIEQACYYFTHTEMYIREVAELCGYSNQFYFSKAFKAIKGISPSEYRIKFHK